MAKPYPTMQSPPYLFYSKQGPGVDYSPAPPVMCNPTSTLEGTTSLHFALGNMRKPDIEILLQQNPEAVHEKGFNGQLPLHKAVLNSDILVIDLLLQYKADPNATNNFNETPFHFACKRGSPPIMNLLVQNGADVNVVDKAGKGAIHHVAHGGSVTGLHFLTEMCGLDTHVRDLNLSTPLHVICAHGHVEALNYILRKDRCDIMDQNAHANNALHIAANAGHGWTCWRVLEEGGLELLHQENREGRTPLDLARSHTDAKYKEVTMLLTYYTVGRYRTGRASGPVMGWYFHGILPVILYPIVLLLASFFSRSGAITLAGLVVMILMLYQHSHRINHVSRWPNPIYFGMFFSGMVHSMLCFYIEVLTSIYENHSVLVQIMAVWNVLFIYVYYVMVTRDPGQATQPAQKPGSLWTYSIRDVADGTVKNDAFCTTCEIIPPKLTHHCKLCLKCYLNTDHHCLFLYRCIAKNNHRLFIYFSMLVVIGIVLFLFSISLYFRYQYPDSPIDGALIYQIFEEKPWVWSVFIANAVSLFWGFNLVRFQLNIVSKAQTTVTQIRGDGKCKLSIKQRLWNTVYFMLGKGLYVTDTTITI